MRDDSIRRSDARGYFSDLAHEEGLKTCHPYNRKVFCVLPAQAYLSQGLEPLDKVVSDLCHIPIPIDRTAAVFPPTMQANRATSPMSTSLSRCEVALHTCYGGIACRESIVEPVVTLTARFRCICRE